MEMPSPEFRAENFRRLKSFLEEQIFSQHFRRLLNIQIS